jgi:hypothetical protein
MVYVRNMEGGDGEAVARLEDGGRRDLVYGELARVWGNGGRGLARQASALLGGGADYTAALGGAGINQS